MVDVSVVITTYGRYNYIGEAIESALRQTLKPKEIVVVADDPDRVPYKDRVYVVEARDRKYGTAIMKGVDATTSETIALLDDDDKFHPDKLRVISRILERHPEVTAVHNHQTYIDVNGKPIGDSDPRVRVYVEGQPEFTLLLNRRNVWRWFRRYVAIHHSHSSMVVRRSIFESHRLIIRDVELMLDFVLFTLSVHDSYYLHIPEKLTIYRVGSGETTMSVWGDPVRVKRRLCMQVRHGYDTYVLHHYVGDTQLRRVIDTYLIDGITTYWLFTPYVDCGVEIPISSPSLLYYTLEDVILKGRGIRNLLGLIYTMMYAMLDKDSLISNELRRRFGIDLESLLRAGTK